MKKTVILFLVAILFSSCGSKECAIPAEPDYSDSTQWYISDRGAAVDVFYIVSTECGDYCVDGKPYHYADTRNDSIRNLLLGEMVGVDRLLAGDLNYYSPYYRQCTMQAFVSNSVMDSRMPLAYSDVRSAFAYYLEHYNNGRPFILAGFSQGAMAVVDLLKTMDDTTYRRLVAAYVIGYKVVGDPRTMACGHPTHIVPAQDSTDIGVTICYNSVRDNSCAVPLLSDGNLMAINPVNWRTDATPARIRDPKSDDTLTVTLDTTSLLLHVDGYSRNDYMLPLIGCEGNYHCLEILLYSDCLRRNMAMRAKQIEN